MIRRCLLDWYWAVLCAEQVDMLLSLSIFGYLGTYIAFSKQMSHHCQEYSLCVNWKLLLRVCEGLAFLFYISLPNRDFRI